MPLPAGRTMTDAELAAYTDLGSHLLASNSIWSAIGVLSEKCGDKVGHHLETLLCKDKHGPTDTRPDVRAAVAAMFDRLDSCVPPCVSPEESASATFPDARTEADGYAWGVVEATSATLQELLGDQMLADYTAVLIPFVRQFVAARLAMNWPTEKPPQPDLHGTLAALGHPAAAELGKVVRAEVHSDDHAMKANFDAARYFRHAELGTLVELAACGWGGDYPADTIAQYFADTTGDVQDVLSYVTNKTQMGFECHVSEDDAARWVAAFRPSWLKVIWPNGVSPKPATDMPYYQELHG